MKDCFCKMMIPYFWFSLINILVDSFRFAFNPEVVGWEVIVTDLIQTVSLFGISVLWFLSTLFLAELCMYGLIRKCPVWLLCVIGVVGAWGSSVGARLVQTHILMETVFFAWLGDLLIALLRVFLALTFLLIGYAAYFCLQRLRLKAAWELLIGVGCLLLNVVVAFANVEVDLHYLIVNRVFYYYLGASSATFGLILICRHIKPFWLPVFLGKNSLIIMLTHLDCRIMRLAIGVATGVNQLIPGDIMFRLTLYLTLLVGEMVMIVLINRFGFFLIGRRRPVQMEGPKRWYTGIDQGERSSF